MEAVLRNVYLYGELGEKFGKLHRIAINSVGEMMRAMECRFPGFKRHIKKDMGYQVCRGEIRVEKEEDLAVSEQLDDDTVKLNFAKGDFHVTPDVEGSGNKGWFQVILGAVLIVVGAVLVYTGVGGPLGGYLINIGIGLMLTGVATLLTPSPNDPNNGESDRPEENKSFLFNGAVNTMRQGGAVSLQYGRYKRGSTVLAVSLESRDVPA